MKRAAKFKAKSLRKDPAARAAHDHFIELCALGMTTAASYRRAINPQCGQGTAKVNGCRLRAAYRKEIADKTEELSRERHIRSAERRALMGDIVRAGTSKAALRKAKPSDAIAAAKLDAQLANELAGDNQVDVHVGFSAILAAIASTPSVPGINAAPTGALPGPNGHEDVLEQPQALGGLSRGFLGAFEQQDTGRPFGAPSVVDIDAQPLPQAAVWFEEEGATP